MEKQALAYLAEGKSFHDTAMKLGLQPNEVIAIYVKDRASK